MRQLVSSIQSHPSIRTNVFSDAEGHTWRDCTAPKDWTRVTCRNCGEKGHTVKRCKQPIKEQENAGPTGGDAASFGNSGGFDNANGGAGGDWNQSGDTGASAGQQDWEKVVPEAPAAAAGGGW